MKQTRSEVHKQNYFRFVFQMSPASFIEMIVWGLLNCIIAVLNVWATRKVVSLVLNGYSREMFQSVCLYGLLLILSAAYSFYYKRYRVQFCTIPMFEQRIRFNLFRKSQKISNETYENPSATKMIRMADGAKQNLFRYVEIWISILMAALQAVAVTMYISTFNLWFLFLLLFSIIPPCLTLLYQTNLWKRYYEAIEQYKREESEYVKGLIDEIACKESRVTYAADLLLQKWNESRTKKNSIERTKNKKIFLLRLLMIPFEFVGSFGGYLVSVILLFCGKIDYASCTAAISAYASIMSAFSSLVSMIGYEGQYKKMIKPFFDYWAVAERTDSDISSSLNNEIKLDHVSFHYSGQERFALEDINLSIKKGEVIAIVGENGAGKTTLTNVILGLFLPSGGTVYYDGIDISTVSEACLHKNQSVVPQNFNRYKMSVRDNIVMGNFNDIDESRIEQKKWAFLGDSGISQNTLLGKEFGGRELSGGQWQQLSCARGFYKNSDFLVLDEATSAIDPLKEKAMYDAFRAELNGKTGIIITHRLGAVSLADRIIVLQHGRIVQEGTHRQLLTVDGPYLQLWNTQTHAFSEE